MISLGGEEEGELFTFPGPVEVELYRLEIERTLPFGVSGSVDYMSQSLIDLDELDFGTFHQQVVEVPLVRSGLDQPYLRAVEVQVLDYQLAPEQSQDGHSHLALLAFQKGTPAQVFDADRGGLEIDAVVAEAPGQVAQRYIALEKVDQLPLDVGPGPVDIARQSHGGNHGQGEEPENNEFDDKAYRILAHRSLLDIIIYLIFHFYRYIFYVVSFSLKRMAEDLAAKIQFLPIGAVLALAVISGGLLLTAEAADTGSQYRVDHGAGITDRADDDDDEDDDDRARDRHAQRHWSTTGGGEVESAPPTPAEAEPEPSGEPEPESEPFTPGTQSSVQSPVLEPERPEPEDPEQPEQPEQEYFEAPAYWEPAPGASQPRKQQAPVSIAGDDIKPGAEFKRDLARDSAEEASLKKLVKELEFGSLANSIAMLRDLVKVYPGDPDYRSLLAAALNLKDGDVWYQYQQRSQAPVRPPVSTVAPVVRPAPATPTIADKINDLKHSSWLLMYKRLGRSSDKGR